MSETPKTVLTTELLDNLKKEYETNQPLHNIMQNVLSKNQITKTIKINDTRIYNRHNFEINIPTMKATNQFSSGRCWIFAG